SRPAKRRLASFMAPATCPIWSAACPPISVSSAPPKTGSRPGSSVASSLHTSYARSLRGRNRRQFYSRLEGRPTLTLLAFNQSPSRGAVVRQFLDPPQQSGRD